MKKTLTILTTTSLLLSACSNTSNKEPEAQKQQENTQPSLPEDTTPTETTTTINERPIVDTKKGGDPYERYLASTEALDIASGEPFADPEYAPLIDLITDRQAEFTLKGLRSGREENLIVKFPENSQSEHILSNIQGEGIFTAESEYFEFADCHVTDFFEKDLDDGSIVFNPGLRTEIKTIEMKRDDEGEWRLNGITVLEKHEGLGECTRWER